MPATKMLSKSNLVLLGRLALFIGTIALLGWFSLIEVGRLLFVDPITRSAVVASHALINLFGGDAAREGTVLVGPQMSLDVKDACNGVVAMVLYVAAVVAHEARIVSKLIGLVLGLAAIWIVNLVRIVTLYGIAAIAPERLEFFHIYFWQTLIIIAVVAFWYIWANWTMKPAAASETPAPR